MLSSHYPRLVSHRADAGQHFGTHPLWQQKGFALTFNESSCHKSLLSLSGGLPLLAGVTGEKEERVASLTRAESGSFTK